MKYCAVFGAGEANMTAVSLPADCLVIAADAGLRYCEKLGIAPALIVGDFDSLGHIPPNAIVLPVEKDVTDMAAAVAEGEKRGCDTFYIYGGSGGRLDHTLANLALLVDLSKKHKTAFLLDASFTATAVTDGEIRFDAGEQGTLSVFAADTEVTGVTETGLKYPLTDATLTNRFPLGVSNAFTGVSAAVRVKKGTLLILRMQAEEG